MENLEKVLATKKLEDLTSTVKPTNGSNLIEPTEAEVELIVTELRKGTPYGEIKKTIRRADNKGSYGFSFGQIKEIEQGMKAKVIELTPKPVEETIEEPKEVTE